MGRRTARDENTSWFAYMPRRMLAMPSIGATHVGMPVERHALIRAALGGTMLRTPERHRRTDGQQVKDIRRTANSRRRSVHIYRRAVAALPPRADARQAACLSGGGYAENVHGEMPNVMRIKRMPHACARAASRRKKHAKHGALQMLG